MLSFRAHHLEVKGKHYIPLPKLNTQQMMKLKGRLTRKGLSVTGKPLTSPTTKDRSIHIEPLGLCWSSSDPSDDLLPLVPEILRCKKEVSTTANVLDKYLRASTEGGRLVLRVIPRLEALANWDYLRANGGSGLTPDEQLITRFLLGKSGGSCSVTTDFAFANARPFYVGRRLYFESNLPALKASDTLRVVGSKGRENSYLPRDGILYLQAFEFRSHELAACLRQLGDWCSFIAA